MTNVRTLNSFQLNSLVKVSEITTVPDPTLVGPLPSTVQLGLQATLNATTNPAVSMSWHEQVTLVAGSSSSSSSSHSSSSGAYNGPSGSLVLDLTNLPDPVLTAVNANGLQLKVIHISGYSTNNLPVTIQPGTGNGYSGWGLGLIVSPNDIQGPLLLTGTPVISSTAKNLLLTGAAGDSVNICFGFG